MSNVKKWLNTNAMAALSLALALYFLVLFHSVVGFPPSSSISTAGMTYLAVTLFLMLVPFAGKLRLGRILEYEAKVEEVRSDVRQFKQEVSALVSAQSAAMAAVSNTIRQNININVPGYREAQEARAELNETIKAPEPRRSREDDIRAFILEGGGDITYALAKLRMNLESELRRILDKRMVTSDPGEMRGRFLSARSLFQEFIGRFPQYEGMRGSFDYILQVCNAAIHGQQISEDLAHEAFDMGLRIRDALKAIDP